MGAGTQVTDNPTRLELKAEALDTGRGFDGQFVMIGISRSYFWIS
jgi:hypothetical protein